MRKIYTIVCLGLLLFQTEGGFAQSSFLFYYPDTVCHHAPVAGGDTSCDGDYILNLTANPLTIDVVRVQDVDIAGSGWTSAFCLDICYPDFVDSVRYTIPPNDTVDFIPHFYFTATPDSQTVYFKVKNVGNPTDVTYQHFHGVTQLGFGIHEYANLANVNIYPSPIVASNAFNMNITNVKVQKKEFSLIIYNIYGSSLSHVNHLKENNNSLNLDLAAGMYSYSLMAGDQIIRTGKLSIIK